MATMARRPRPHCDAARVPPLRWVLSRCRMTRTEPKRCSLSCWADVVAAQRAREGWASSWDHVLYLVACDVWEGQRSKQKTVRAAPPVALNGLKSRGRGTCRRGKRGTKVLCRVCAPPVFNQSHREHATSTKLFKIVVVSPLCRSRAAQGYRTPLSTTL